MFNDSPIIGIDLGTTYCCVGVLTAENHVEIIENEDGNRTTPSYVAFSNNKKIIGNLAKETVFREPENVVYDSKRLIGKGLDDRYLQQNLNTWTFKISADENNQPLINISQEKGVEYYKPQDISAIILKHLKNIAEQSLEAKITDAVITVPAYFNYNQRTATKEAGELAGLNVLKIVNEPTAAALAYIHKHKITDCKSMVVFDLGGGTFDVSVLQVFGKSVTIRATSGNTHLGGRDFDNNLANFIVEEIKEQYGISLMDRKAIQRIRAKSERIKIKLSTQTVAYLDFSNLIDKNDINIKISRESFEKVNRHLFRRCIQTVENCLKDAKVEKADVAKIVLVGGSTRIPKLQEMLKTFFEERDLCKSIHPDEAVAYGAAVQAAMFKRGNKKETAGYVTEVTPLSLGTDILGERMSFIISRNTAIPLTKTVSYLTTKDKQSTMCFNIYEGERSLVKYNNKLGTTTIELPQKPPGYSVDVTFHIDENGILEIGAKTETGIYSALGIDYNKHDSHVTNDAIQDALENKLSDQRKYDAITLWSQLNEYCTKMIAICNYNRKNMKSEEKRTVKTTVEKGVEWLNNNKIELGTEDEKRCILKKQQEMYNICEPIVNKYGYNVKSMSILEFYNLIAR